MTRASYEARSSYDPDRINAVVLLTDGVNDDGVAEDDEQQLETMLQVLRRGSTGETAKPIRIFPIAFAQEADLGVLRTIAEATNSAAYNASDPKTIAKVFTAVVSNF
ncbi:MAG: hypothetical protein WKF43_16705 [Acidimicrobiales bacterium]